MITRLKDLLDFQILDTRNGKKVQCIVNPPQDTSSNFIGLFYVNDDTDTLALKLGKHTQVIFNQQPVQVAVRHNDYDICRTLALNSLKFLGTNRDQIGMFIDTSGASPVYAGIDDTGAFIFVYDIKLKGAE